MKSNSQSTKCWKIKLKKTIKKRYKKNPESICQARNSGNETGIRGEFSALIYKKKKEHKVIFHWVAWYFHKH